MNLPDAGQVFEVKYPFIRGEYTEMDADGPCTAKCWHPGVEFVSNGPRDADAVADGVGTQVLTVVSTHKPGHYPPRVFYTRKWRDPDGKEFGKNSLHVSGAAHFTTLCRGYHYQVEMRVRVNA